MANSNRPTLTVVRVKKPDTRCNDNVTVSIHVNSKFYQLHSNFINTQAEFRSWKESAKKLIDELDLETLSKFGA